MYNVAKATAMASIAAGILNGQVRKDDRPVRGALSQCRASVDALPAEQQQLVALMFLNDYAGELFGMNDEADE